jgi:hypothetical protein
MLFYGISHVLLGERPISSWPWVSPLSSPASSWVHILFYWKSYDIQYTPQMSMHREMECSQSSVIGPLQFRGYWSRRILSVTRQWLGFLWCCKLVTWWSESSKTTSSRAKDSSPDVVAYLITFTSSRCCDPLNRIYRSRRGCLNGIASRRLW